MENWAAQLTTLVAIIHQQLPFTLAIIAGLWGLHFINWALGYRLNYLGLYPRTLHGFIGIFFSPFLHGHFNHLFFNSIPLFVLMNLMMITGIPHFYLVSAIIIVGSG